MSMSCRGTIPPTIPVPRHHEVPVPSTLSLAGTPAVYGQTTTLTATLLSNGSPVSNAPITFSRADNSIIETATTNGSGVAVLSNVSVAGLDIGTHSNAFIASFAGDSTH